MASIWQLYSTCFKYQAFAVFCCHRRGLLGVKISQMFSYFLFCCSCKLRLYARLDPALVVKNLQCFCLVPIDNQLMSSRNALNKCFMNGYFSAGQYIKGIIFRKHKLYTRSASYKKDENLSVNTFYSKKARVPNYSLF